MFFLAFLTKTKREQLIAGPFLGKTNSGLHFSLSKNNFKQKQIGKEGVHVTYTNSTVALSQQSSEMAWLRQGYRDGKSQKGVVFRTPCMFLF